MSLRQKLFVALMLMLAAIIGNPHPVAAATVLENTDGKAVEHLVVDADDWVAVGFRVPENTVWSLSWFSFGDEPDTTGPSNRTPNLWVGTEVIKATVYSNASNRPGSVIAEIDSVTFESWGVLPNTLNFAPEQQILLNGGQTYWIVVSGHGACYETHDLFPGPYPCGGSTFGYDSRPTGVFSYLQTKTKSGNGVWIAQPSHVHFSLHANLISGSLDGLILDDRLNQGLGDHFGIVYADPKQIEVYAAEGSNGYLMLTYLVDDIPDCVAKLPEHRLLSESDNGLFSLWQLDTCWLQVNMGPDKDGKVYVLTFDAAPPNKIHHYVLE